MVLDDILELAESPEYSSHPKQQPGELVGFTVPDWMIEKMKVQKMLTKIQILAETQSISEDSIVTRKCYK
jgi:hypothetical protein